MAWKQFDRFPRGILFERYGDIHIVHQLGEFTNAYGFIVFMRHEWSRRDAFVHEIRPESQSKFGGWQAFQSVSRISSLLWIETAKMRLCSNNNSNYGLPEPDGLINIRLVINCLKSFHVQVFL